MTTHPDPLELFGTHLDTWCRIDRGGLAVRCNAAFASLFNGAADGPPLPFGELVARHDKSEQQRITAVLNEVLEHQLPRTVVASAMTEAGVRFYSWQLIPDEDVVSTYGRDVTALCDRLRESEAERDLLRDATESSEVGLWVQDLATGTCRRNDVAGQLLGFPTRNALPPHADAWRERIHPDDYLKVERSLKEHLGSPDVPYDVSYRVRDIDGEFVRVQVRGRARRDESGVLRIFAGSVTRLDSNDQPA